jgi:hypothetical protein
VGRCHGVLTAPRSGRALPGVARRGETACGAAQVSRAAATCWAGPISPHGEGPASSLRHAVLVSVCSAENAQALAKLAAILSSDWCNPARE